MIGAVGAAQPIYGPATIFPTTGVEDMAIEAAAFEPEITEVASPPPPEPLNDPAADAIAASQMYPQLMVGSVYTGVSTEAVMAVEEDAVGTTDNDDRDDAMGQLLFGQDGREQALPGEETEVAEGEELEPEIMGDPAAAAETEAEAAAESEEAEAATDPERAGTRGANGQALSDEEMAQVRELANRDREVRAHEQAHKSVGGQYSGGMSFSYQQGPDGQRYATGGEVGIDVSPEQTPEATIAKMQQVRAAAMAPADPSPQDHAVASSAMATESQARAEAASQNNPANAAAGEGESGETSGTGEAKAAAGQSDAASSAAVDRAEQTAASGGIQTLSSNRFINAYAARSATENDLSQNRFNSTVMSASYRPIDIVA